MQEKLKTLLISQLQAMVQLRLIIALRAVKRWTLFQWGSKVSTNWSNTWKHACFSVNVNMKAQ